MGRRSRGRRETEATGSSGRRKVPAARSKRRPAGAVRGKARHARRRRGGSAKGGGGGSVNLRRERRGVRRRRIVACARSRAAEPHVRLCYGVWATARGLRRSSAPRPARPRFLFRPGLAFCSGPASRTAAAAARRPAPAHARAGVCGGTRTLGASRRGGGGRGGQFLRDLAMVYVIPLLPPPLSRGQFLKDLADLLENKVLDIVLP